MYEEILHDDVSELRGKTVFLDLGFLSLSHKLQWGTSLNPLRVWCSRVGEGEGAGVVSDLRSFNVDEIRSGASLVAMECVIWISEPINVTRN